MALNLKATLALDGSGFAAGASAVSRQLAGLKGLIASTFSVAAITAAAKSTINYASELTDLSKRLGVSTDFLQEFQAAAKKNGAEMEDLIRIIETFRAKREEALGGDVKAGALFSAFGISPGALRQGRIEDLIFGPIRDSLTSSDVQGKIGAAFREIGGKGAGNIIAAFDDMTPQMRAQVRESAGFMTQEVVDELDRMGDKFDEFALRLKGFVGNLIVGAEQLINELSGKGTPTIRKPISRALVDAMFGPMYGPENQVSWPGAPSSGSGNRGFMASDSLVAVGNFLGKGPQIINQIAETNKILNTHTRLLSDINRKMTGSSGFPTT